ncbi:type III PLP-dependent enzyme [Marinicella sp. S1101]|uniref:type III PLP-dependent enzyme n=1 Tax=Marinicella marina TaxID=2996016 RepID=UPI002260986E|nr:type III PLP-dependent enzyme [Marinicella marina]MCX7552333.1 type III PLP-dependent enzyme [Marinicella marina]MDJ1139208.1 type III PLP-dependent enzyme [Marinicella marina]
MNQVQELKAHFAEQVYPDQLGNYSRRKLAQLAAQHGTPTVIIDQDIITRQYQNLIKALPQVKMRYAIKALPHPEVVKHLAQLGCGFDLATAGEIELLRSLSLDAADTIHTHPIKKDSEIRHAIEFGCQYFVVDNSHELDKFIAYKDQVELLIRVNFRNQDAVVDLSRKFGCELTKLPALVAQAKSLGINIVGLSFHVGSQVPAPYAHVEAIEQCLDVFANMPEVNWKILDIGGGFPIEYTGPGPVIEDFCAPINAALQAVGSEVEVLAEPGRYIAGPSAIQLLSVVGMAQRGARTWYYLDDGVYGVLSGQMFDHAKYPIAPLKSHDMTQGLMPSVLAGPTCDSIDVIDDDIVLPPLEIGDIFVVTQVGAYSLASATEFNLYPKANALWLSGQKELMAGN